MVTDAVVLPLHVLGNNGINTQDKGVLAFHQEGILLPVPSQQGVMEEIQIHVCLYSS